MSGVGTARRAAALGVALVLMSCTSAVSPPDPTDVNPRLVALASGPALALMDALEALIAEDRASAEDRAYAYAVVAPRDPSTAPELFARAGIAGRMAQLQGIDVADHITDVEVSARRSASLDPNFRDGAALRTLGTLYVLAPGGMLRHGDADKGLEILQTLAKTWPDNPQHRLRLAEALLTMDELERARPHLCWCIANKARLRADEQAFLTLLVEDADVASCP